VGFTGCGKRIVRRARFSRASPGLKSGATRGFIPGTNVMKSFSGLGGRKAPNSMGKISTVGVLRLRATSAVSRDKSVSAPLRMTILWEFDEDIRSTFSEM